MTFATLLAIAVALAMDAASQLSEQGKAVRVKDLRKRA